MFEKREEAPKNFLEKHIGILCLAALVCASIALLFWAGYVFSTGVSYNYAPIEYTTIETAIEEAESNAREITFIDGSDDAYNLYNGSNPYYSFYSCWDMLTREEQAETLQRVYTTDAHFLAYIMRADEIAQKYDRYIRKPERIYRHEELAGELQADIDELTGYLEERRGCYDKCVSDDWHVSRWPDGVCVGSYLEYVVRNEWRVGVTKLEDERIYIIYTYDYANRAWSYLSSLRGILEDLYTLTTNHEWLLSKQEGANKYRFDHQDYREAVLNVCEARMYMYLQLGIDFEDVTPEYLAQRGYPIDRPK